MQVTLGYIKNPAFSRLAAASSSQPTVEAQSLEQSAPQDSYKHSVPLESGMMELRRRALASGLGTSAGGAPGQRGAQGQSQGGGSNIVRPAVSAQVDELRSAKRAGRKLNKEEQATFNDALGVLNGLGGRFAEVAKDLKKMDAQGLIRNDSAWVLDRGGNAETVRDSKSPHYGINLSDVMFTSDTVLKKRSKSEDLDRFSKAAQLAGVLAHEHKHFQDTNRYYSTKSCERPGWSEEMSYWNQLVIQTRANRSPEVCDIALRLAQGREDEGVALGYLDHRRVYRP